MEHLSEVIKILDAALMHDTRKATAYGNLLASKLDEERQPRQARAVRTVLAKLPAEHFSSSDGVPAIPVDSDHSISIVDFKRPGELEPPNLVLHPYVESRVQEFLQAVRQYDLWAASGIEPANRLLIFGPPGTGKTSIAAMIAHDLDLPLVVSRSDALVSSLLGQTSRNIRSIFDFAQATPCVLFLDEFDALAKDRKDAREIGELQRVVIALLQNIDAIHPSTVLIAATNHPELLDPATWRRFEFTLRVELPGPIERQAMWELTLGKLAPDGKEMTRLVELSDELSGAAIKLVANDVCRIAIQSGGQQPELPTILRRLARVLWYDSFGRFESNYAEMSALREWAPDVFTVRALANMFDVSNRQVQNAIKGD